MTSDYTLRQATAADYDAIAPVVNEWWGRDVQGGLSRLFLDHFHTTSLIAENDRTMVGFLVGFHSPSASGEAYIHYVGVDPAWRGRGVARRLYEEFMTGAARLGCRMVRAITAPVNETSIAFHRRMGFDVQGPLPEYNGPGHAMILFTRPLTLPARRE